MNDRDARPLHLLALWLLVTLAAWPVFVAVATSLGLWSGEARQIDAWALEPKRTLLAHFLDGWRASLVVAVPLGLLAVIDHLLLSRHRATRPVRGILLPIAGVAVALALRLPPATTLPVLAASGLLLAVLYRAFDGTYRRVAGIR